MANYNKVLLMGNLTRDPELRYLQSGTAVVNFGIATNRKYRNRTSQEMVEETTFVDVEGWGPQAETFNRYMSKGRPVFVEGRLRLDSWEGKDGQKRNKLRVVMENFQFVGGAPANRDAPSSRPAKPPFQAGQVSDHGNQQQAEDYDFDDIPF
ncbi:MAG: single-stranded DNA-binding protein [Planctomycetota bacterium]|jgi:single-strand DNA-binding protein